MEDGRRLLQRHDGARADPPHRQRLPQDIEAVGRGIATAFIATIYGVGGANLLFIPIGGRIKLRVKEIMNIKEMMLQGVLAIQEGTNPKLVRDRLSSFLKDEDRINDGEE